MKNLVVALGLFALAAPGIANAQVVQTYAYDANGRLTGVATSGSAGAHASTYAYDRADNRVSRSQTGASAWASLSRLPVHQWLQPDEALFSPDGRYSFALRDSGRLELWFGDAPADLQLQPETTNFRLTGEGVARFEPSSSVLVDAWLVLGDDGALVLIDGAEQELWRSESTEYRGVAQ